MGNVMVPNCVPIAEEMKKIQSEKGIDLAAYPWDECVADQTERYGDEETAKKVCGYIKSEYGGGE
jgi:CRISPR/Cas system-associated endoribonuclease Cas2